MGTAEKGEIKLRSRNAEEAQRLKQFDPTYGMKAASLVRVVARRLKILDALKKGEIEIATRDWQLSKEDRERLRKPGKPACFDSQNQWDDWRHAARQAPPANISTYCEDCTVDYQARMRAEKRCEWWHTQFFSEGKNVSGAGFRVFIIELKQPKEDTNVRSA